MTESQPPVYVGRARWERTAAFLLLRLFLGLRSLLAGVDKFESEGVYSLENYRRNAGHLASGITGASFLPLWATRDFALALGFLLVGLGVALLLGLRTRLCLTLSGALYVALAFGLMAAEDAQGVAWLGIHLALVVAALVLSGHDRLALWPDRDE